MHTWKTTTLFILFSFSLYPLSASANQFTDQLCTAAQVNLQPAAMAGAGGLCANLATATYGDISSTFEGSSTQASNSQVNAVKNRLEEIKEGKPIGIFVMGSYNDEKRKDTRVETGYNANNTGITIGLDYPFTEIFTAGLSIGRNQIDSTFHAQAGSSKVTSTSLTAYVNVLVGEHAYVDVYLGSMSMDYTNNRRVSVPDGTDTMTGVTKGSQWTAGLAVGSDFMTDYLIITPEFALDYSTNSIDGYDEAASAIGGLFGYNMRYSAQKIKSTLSTLGVTAALTDVGLGSFTPALTVKYMHEFAKKDISVNNLLVDRSTVKFASNSDKPNTNFFIIKPTASYVFYNGVQLFGGVAILAADTYLNRVTYNAGARWEF